MAYNFTQKLRFPNSKCEVLVDPESKYGYYEHDIQGEGGGLWFATSESQPGKLELIDYDGRFELPLNVAKALKEAGYIVDEVYFP